ncbi:MAG: hypothetical protein HOO96_00435 [Polyangiaceae bacterium]|nr:hypothetical protein [Polyangiaceae bacterium]
MKLHLFEHTCAQCGAVFMAPHLPPVYYGTFLLRGDEDELVLLDALESQAYREFSELLRSCPETAGMSDSKRADLLLASFSACDLGAKGGPLRYREPACPHCHTRDVGDVWRSTEPAQHVDWEPVYATFARWSSLEPDEKQREVRTALQELLKRNDDRKH